MHLLSVLYTTLEVYNKVLISLCVVRVSANLHGIQYKRAYCTGNHLGSGAHANNTAWSLELPCTLGKMVRSDSACTASEAFVVEGRGGRQELQYQIELPQAFELITRRVGLGLRTVRSYCARPHFAARRTSY